MVFLIFELFCLILNSLNCMVFNFKHPQHLEQPEISKTRQFSIKSTEVTEFQPYLTSLQQFNTQ